MSNFDFTPYHKVTLPPFFSRVFQHGSSYFALFALLLGILGGLEDGLTTLVLLFLGAGCTPFVLTWLRTEQVRFCVFVAQFRETPVEILKDLSHNNALSERCRVALKKHLFYTYAVGDKPRALSVLEYALASRPLVDFVGLLTLLAWLTIFDVLALFPSESLAVILHGISLLGVIGLGLKMVLHQSFTYAYVLLAFLVLLSQAVLPAFP